MHESVPFYSNTPDDTHCFQAGTKMVAKYFWPQEDYSWEQLEKITAKIDGLWTWPTAGLLWLQSKGAEIKIVEMFDYPTFVEEGKEYLLSYYGSEVGSAQIQHSDIPHEVSLVKQALPKLQIEQRIPTFRDIRALLDEGFLVCCNVNSMALNGKLGYVGHFVVIFSYTDNSFTLHDPGLPAQESREVSFEQFEKAWAYPEEKAKGLMAMKVR